ncbi:MAG: flagellar motor protein MotB [Fidelibacterota bacterium]|nr:MAG: flagellar motor protein MotB [Candidatus Neomarinimicrobiota bacterium]
MAIKKREDEGLPEYFATFADMMTLLMTFFVLLFSMSSLDPVKIADMAAAMQENATGARAERRQIKTQSQIRDEVLEAIEQTQMQDVAEVTHSPKGTSITIDSRFAFESGSADLKSVIYPFLNSIIPIMMDRGTRFPIAVEGHTDNLPIPEAWTDRYPSNWELSAARAASVVRYCIERGVPGGKLRAVGFAEWVPAGTNWADTRIGVTEEDVQAGNSSPELQSQNRRVEITFLSIG